MSHNSSKITALTGVDAGFSDVSHGSSLHDVTDDKLLDGLVFGDAASAVGASYGVGVPATMFGPSVIAAFASLKS